MCSPRSCACCLLGGVEDVVRCALLERLGARRASSSCRGRGWGGTPRGPCCHRLRHARAERRYGGSWHTRAARERRRRRSKVSRRRRAGRAPPARRGRRVCVPRAFKRPAKTFGWGWWWWWVVRTPTPNYLRQASPDRGKYTYTIYIVLSAYYMQLRAQLALSIECVHERFMFTSSVNDGG